MSCALLHAHCSLCSSLLKVEPDLCCDCATPPAGSAGPYARQLKGRRLHVAAFAVEDEPKSADAEPAAQSVPGTLSAQNASGATTASNSSTSASSKGAARTARWSPRVGGRPLESGSDSLAGAACPGVGLIKNS